MSQSFKILFFLKKSKGAAPNSLPVYIRVTVNIFHVQKEFALRNEPVTAGQVRSIILHKNKKKKHSLVEVYQYHNDQFEKLVGGWVFLRNFQEVQVCA